MMTVQAIAQDKYTAFAAHHFASGGKILGEGVLADIYQRFDGITWYVQKMLDELYSLTAPGETCTREMIDVALQNILSSYESAYQDMLVQLPARQVALLKAICMGDRVRQITSGKFIKAHHLDSVSSVQKACQAL